MGLDGEHTALGNRQAMAERGGRLHKFDQKYMLQVVWHHIYTLSNKI